MSEKNRSIITDDCNSLALDVQKRNPKMFLFDIRGVRKGIGEGIKGIVPPPNPDKVEPA